MTKQRPSIFDSVTLGEIELPNRIVMASMSRARANNDGFVPALIQAEYYSQRASAGLIMSEGIWPSREAVGAAWVPGLFSDPQIEGWRNVTDAVHAAGGQIVAQLGHAGGASHPALLDGNLPLAPSAVSLNQPVFTGKLENSPVPQAMTSDDIARTIDDYRQATWRAREAGFDGVELHGTVGFLIPQFLNDGFNQREDRYGGSLENRVRFPLEVLEAMIAEWTPGRIGLKLSPAVGLGDLQPTTTTLPTYEHLVTKVNAMKIAYLQLQDSPEDLTDTPVAALKDGTARHFRPLFDGPIIANGGFDLTSGQALLAAGDADAVAFGTPYLANPDLVERLRDGLALAPVPPRETWYGGGAAGYTDYPRASNG